MRGMLTRAQRHAIERIAQLTREKIGPQLRFYGSVRAAWRWLADEAWT
jgi:hypothetical protein